MKRLAILGSGQLAMMLGEAAQRLGVPARALESSRLEDPEALDSAFADADVVTLENEFIDTELLERVRARYPRVEIHPSLDAIRETRDKLRQKRVFVELGVDTAPFEGYRGTDEGLRSWLEAMSVRFKAGSMLKWSRWGYDGKGNCPYRKPSDLDVALAFCREGLARGAEIYAEEWIPWEQELAIVATRAPDGTMAAFPLVRSYQEKSVCREVRGPAVALGVPASAEDRARETAGKLGERLGMTGTFAVEFFWTREGRMLANEMAPRVHNTGHYSRHSGLVSQFENHVRAVAGLELRDPGEFPLFGMRNLLGPATASGQRIEGAAAEEFLSKAVEGIEATWYFKDTVHPWRKMGHLTAVDRSSQELEARMEAMARLEESFWAKFMRGSKA